MMAETSGEAVEVVALVLGVGELHWLRGSMAQVSEVFAVRSVPRSERSTQDMLGVDEETLGDFRSAMTGTWPQIDQFFDGDRAAAGAVLHLEVHAAGLHAGLTLTEGEDWSVRLVTTPQVVALWRACMDLTRRYWGDAELGNVVGCTVEGWEALEAKLARLDPAIENAYLGRHRPGAQYSVDEQRRMFGKLLKW